MKAVHCFSKTYAHQPHEWTYGGQPVQCDGSPQYVQPRWPEPERQCCSDPLCGCAQKPGWGAHAAPGRPKGPEPEEGQE